MTYKLMARDRVFCEGTEAECQKALTGIAHMINAGFATNFKIEEFVINKYKKSNFNDEDI